MNKKIIQLLICIIISSFLIITSVLAFGEGDILTQQQVDNIPADTVGLQCHFGGFGLQFPLKNALFLFSCLNIKPNGNLSNYLIIRNSWTQQERIALFVMCLRNNEGNPSARTICVQEMRDRVLAQFSSKKQLIRENIKKYQTSSDLSSEDFPFSDGDLN